LISPLAHRKGRFSLTYKLLLLAVIVGFVSWGVLDNLQKRAIEEVVDNHLVKTVRYQAQGDRSRLDSYLEQQSQTVKVFSQVGAFQNYIKKQVAAGWEAEESPTLIIRSGRAPWLPNRSTVRSLTRAPIILLFDPKQRLREVFWVSPNPSAQTFLNEVSPGKLVIDDGESILMEHQERLYLVSASEVLDEEEDLLSTLVLVIPIDSQFLFGFHRRSLATGVVAFLDTEGQKVLASSHPEKISRGASLYDIKKDYFINSKPFFDFGYASNLPISYASLISLHEIRGLMGEMVVSQRIYRFLTALVLICAFGGILIWIASRLRNFTNEMTSYSRKHLGISGRENTEVRDELDRMGVQFIQLVEEAITTREKERVQRNQLIQTEKMASLGGLVAGIAHEINTPVGVAMTASTFLSGEIDKLQGLIDNKQLRRSDLDSFLMDSQESSKLIFSNLRNAANLVRSFKQVAVDQSNEATRTLSVKPFIEEVLLTLRPLLKRTAHRVQIDCSDELKINTLPGAFSQIITNLVTNSLKHGFDEGVEGVITLNARLKLNHFTFYYKDNGKGMEGQQVERLYEPFFTTKRSEGGTGLGMHIVFNLATQTLGGQIECQSRPKKGTEFIIQFPVNC
jgi:signal transduction histidine kinase